MPIVTQRDSTGQLTEHVVTGTVTDDEMFQCQREFYEGGPTVLQLWDLTGAELTEVTTEGMRRFMERAASLGRVRTGGRTAVIVQTKLQYGLGRVAEVYAEFIPLPFEFGIFEDREEALAWLRAAPALQPPDPDGPHRRP